MRLIDTDVQEKINNTSGYKMELWDMGRGSTARIFINEISCTIYISTEEKNITMDVARLLGVNSKIEGFSLKPVDDVDLYLKFMINTVAMVYREPKKYMELLKKIEAIINEKL